MASLFEPSQIQGLTLANRFVRSATWDGLADENGICTPEVTDLLVGLARGGVGLIITGHAYVRRDGQAGPRQLGMYSEQCLDGLEKMAAAVHRAGGKVVLQISHAGFFSHPKLIGKPPLAPSAVEGYVKSPRAELSVDDILDIGRAFARASKWAKEVGADGVQLHAAHGYLISQFLSAPFNKRTDAYGGSVENRARFLLDVLEQTRDAVGPDFPVMVKMNSDDLMDGGLTIEDSLQTAGMLSDAGIDAIELSGGTQVSGDRSPLYKNPDPNKETVYFLEAAQAFKERIRVPLILVGGIRSFHTAERIVEQGAADYISMCRPFIREPNLIARWRDGDLRDATCISDTSCFGVIAAGKGFYCPVARKEQESRGG